MLHNLLTLADSAFPSGSHGHSNGLEFAIQSGRINNSQEIETWTFNSLAHTIKQLDIRAIIKIYYMDKLNIENIKNLNEEISCMRGSLIQSQANSQIGRSIFRSSNEAWSHEIKSFLSDNLFPFYDYIKNDIEAIQFPIAWAIISKSLSFPLQSSIEAFTFSLIKQNIQIALRLALFGQFEGLRIQAQINKMVLPLINNLDYEYENLQNFESNSALFDFCGLGHEYLEKRYFRS